MIPADHQQGILRSITVFRPYGQRITQFSHHFAVKPVRFLATRRTTTLLLVPLPSPAA